MNEKSNNDLEWINELDTHLYRDDYVFNPNVHCGECIDYDVMSSEWIIHSGWGELTA